jgi:NAD(P)-dependent dehydrogenase (short-subunit alcohol dehydrogenase family)
MSDKGIYLVTGAASGIGKACAAAFADRGERVLLCDLNEAPLKAAAGELRDRGAQAHALAADVTSADDLAALATRIGEEGGLAGCVHAAGLSGTMASAQRIIAVNLDGTDRLLDTLLPLVHEGAGVVCIASQAGHFWAGAATDEVKAILLDDGADDRCVRLTAAMGVEELDSASGYALSKYGVLRLVVKRAPEFGQRGARLVSLSPGVIETPMGNAEMEVHQESMQAIIDMTPVGGRKGRPEEIASAAAFLCSPGASFVSGTDLLVDGGSTHQVLGA